MSNENKASNKTIYKWVWSHMMRMPWWCAGTLFFSTLAFVCQIVTPLLVADFLATFESKNFSPQDSIIAGIIAAGVAWGGYYLFQFIQYQINGFFQTQAISNILNQLHDHVQRGKSEWFGDQQSGSLLVKITRAARGYEVFTDNLYLNDALIPSIIGAFATIIILGIKFPTIAIGLFIITLIAILSLVWNALYRVRPAYSTAIAEESIISGLISDRLSNYMLVKSFAQEKSERASLRQQIEKWRKLEQRSWSTNHVSGLIYGLLLMFAVIWAAWQCIIEFNAGTMQLSGVTFVILTVMEINNFTFNLGRIFLLLQQSTSDMEEGVGLLSIRQERPLIPQQHAQLSPEITLSDLKFGYGDNDKTVLDIPDFKLHAGQRLGVVGHSGAGKSTLVGLLLGFYESYEGRVLFGDQELGTISLDNLRSQIALIPQDTTLFHRSLMENIRYGRMDASDAEVIEAAKRAHADEFIRDLPQGYATLVGERGVKLSGGQRQRIAIARAILKDAPILILDEATSALDSESEKLIQDSLKELMEGKTVLVIAHRLSTIAHLDRLIVMDQGKIIEDGTHDALKKKKGGIYASLWNMQSGGFLGE